MKYWSRVSGNRWLVAKMFGVLMVGHMVWIVSYLMSARCFSCFGFLSRDKGFCQNPCLAYIKAQEVCISIDVAFSPGAYVSVLYIDAQHRRGCTDEPVFS